MAFVRPSMGRLSTNAFGHLGKRGLPEGFFLLCLPGVPGPAG